ncbi:hypothetical protein V865_003338 [Kwoniella europaea PYCC6329]|uniref:Allergen n=1 Tax=Kwoniella europaea PYCC6329 TaxID=1423913 RepID=A0AAX4KIC3_9TREE
MAQNEDIKLHTDSREAQVDHKPTIIGKITKNPDKIIEGQFKKTGHPTDLEQGQAHVQELGHGVEDKHSHDHMKESPHLSPSERSPVNPNSEGNVNTPAEGAHHLHDSVHASEIPHPPGTTNPYVMNQSATPIDNAAAQRGTSHQATNIPLPPSHQNSFANYTPTTPGEGGTPSSGYLAHGGLPSAGQGHSDVGLGQGGVADRSFFPPAHTQNEGN